MRFEKVDNWRFEDQITRSGLSARWKYYR